MSKRYKKTLGTTIIVGPTATVKAFWAKVPGSATCSTSVCGATGYYTFPCASAPSISFTFGGVSFPIAAADFNSEKKTPPTLKHQVIMFD